LNLGLLSGG